MSLQCGICKEFIGAISISPQFNCHKCWDNVKKELETTKKLLGEARALIEEMCVDDCGIDLANEDRESLEAIIMGNDEKCVKFLVKLSKEGGING